MLDGVPPGFELHPAFALELAAAEPVTVDPIDLAFDERGRAFVLELPGYPDMERPARIVELLDPDGDGRWDGRRLFADDLGMADSILPWRRGLLVAAPPHLVYLEDTDGDGRADRRDVLLSGFAEGNPQHNVNALRYGLDNWIHGVNGGNGARVFWPGAPDEVEDIGQDDFRVDFASGRFERTGRGAGGFGMTFGPWGRAFGTHNLDHLSQVVVPRRYLARLPAAWQGGRLRLAAPADGGPAELFPIGVRQTRPNHPEQSSRFSAACAVTAYAGGAFDDAFDRAWDGTFGGASDGASDGVSDDASGAAAPARGGLHVFVADPSANVVHRAVVDASGAAAEAGRGRPGVELLASTDPLFRPVNLTVGPDGALYVLDMHRAVVEHPEWIPDPMEAELDLYEGDDRGRIYRVVPAGGLPAGLADFRDFDRSRPGELLDALSSPNRWRRLTAQRLLVEEFAEDPPETVVRGLRERLGNAAPLGRLHALWTLNGIGALDRESVGAAFGDPEPELRRNAILAFEEALASAAAAGPLEAGRRAAPDASRSASRPEPVSETGWTTLAPDVLALIDDPDPGVRLQAMLTAGLGVGSEAVGVGSEAGGGGGFQGAAIRAVVEEAARLGGDAPTPPVPARDVPWLRLAAVSVLAEDPVRSLGLLLEAGDAGGETVERVAALVPAERLAEVVAGERVTRALSASGTGASGWGRGLLAGLTAAAAGAGDREVDGSGLLAPLRRLRQSEDDALAAAAWRLSAAVGARPAAAEIALLDCAGFRAADRGRPAEERLQALALFGLRRHWPAAPEEAAVPCPGTGGAAGTVSSSGTWLERMGALLGAEQPREVQRAAMAELASAEQDAVTAYLVERWRYLGPDARRDAGGYLIRGRGRHAALLDAIESGRIGLGEMNFDLERRRFLLRSPEPEIRRRARALFDDAGVVTRAEAIAAMRPALELAGDPERGEALFLELCARCHRSGGFGSGPGPDLSGIGRKSAETLLHDILDPNAAVDAAWVNYVVETVDGEVHSGLLAESAGGGIVLRAAEDLLIEVPAERVREVRSDGLSMMPEELEAGLAPADMADLLAFLSR